jgi:16S rRNA (cytosine1402-N4)-methyltransferase
VTLVGEQPAAARSNAAINAISTSHETAVLMVKAYRAKKEFTTENAPERGGRAMDLETHDPAFLRDLRALRGESLHTLGSMSPRSHIPVLLNEVLAALDPQPGDVYLDCTAGLGGHAAAVATHVGPTGTVVLVDLDPGNLASAAERLRSAPNPPRILTERGNFAEAPFRLEALGLRANCVLADLGFASPQVDDPSRGLSFQTEGPLDMRLDPSGSVTAADLVNRLNEGELERILREFGEEREARRVAQKLTRERVREPITTTTRLAAIVRGVVGPRHPGGVDPATRTFQALRIAVNDELGNLDALLHHVERGAKQAAVASARPSWLAPKARVGVISFHSLEDRPVKRTFEAIVKAHLATSTTDGLVTASDAELSTNPRGRSAKLRGIRLLTHESV